MRSARAAVVAVVAAVLLAAALACGERPEDGARGPSPYAGWEGRPIKALAPADVERLLAGDGMGYALAAELNRYPGPRHVLELADSLGLSGGQRDSVEAIRARMSARAVELGRAIVAAEAARAPDSRPSRALRRPARIRGRCGGADPRRGCT